MNINKQYISKKNTYAGKNNSKYIVMHETDNWAVGAGAERHAKAQYLGNLKTSVHFYSGSDGVYQAAELTDGTYSVGTEYGGNHSIKDATNKNTINIEICVNADGDYSIAYANAIELVKHLISTTGIPADRVIRHYDAKGKYCPRKMMDNPVLWENFVNQIKGKATLSSAQDKLKQALHLKPGNATLSDAKQELRAALNLANTVPESAPVNSSSNNAGNTSASTDSNMFSEKFSPHIKDLQWALNQDGITDSNGNKLVEDGIWGPKTQSAVLKVLLSTKTIHQYTNVTAWIQCRVDAIVDGLFGAKTKAAVMEFQKSHGLVVDGIVGKDTMMALVGMYV